MANTTADTETAPIVVPPSGLFEGNNGPWSTFDIHVGTPPQPMRVLVSFIAGETWVISANKTQGGCSGATDPPSCPQARGGLFSTNLSTSWNNKGLYDLDIESNLDDYLDPYDVGDFGFDAMGLGLAGSGGIRFESQTIAAIATKDYYLGLLGLHRYPTNFTSFTDGDVSFLDSMKVSRNIPSMSGAYSAGARYRNETLATLTLGGYDKARVSTTLLSLSMASDISRDLVVNVESILFNDRAVQNRNLSSGPYLVFIDPTVPEIWLPKEACSNFEDAFGLVYNSTVNRYLINDTLHDTLQKQNASVSFILSDSQNRAATVNINLPYASFDLSLGPPIVDVVQNYFPLRRAANETQYTLGRTFLQESYLIVDYERQNFSISQNDWYGDTTPQIVPISSTTPTDVSSVVTNSSTNNGRYKMPTSTIAGISVSASFGFVIAALVTSFYFLRRRRRSRENLPRDIHSEDTFDPFAKAEMDGSGKTPLAELDVPWRSPVEADGSARIEMPSNLGKRTELAGSRVSVEIEGRNVAAEERLGSLEMDAETHGLSKSPSPSRRTGGSTLAHRQIMTGKVDQVGNGEHLAKSSTSDREEW